jgi:hypothetical protein
MRGNRREYVGPQKFSSRNVLLAYYVKIAARHATRSTRDPGGVESADAETSKGCGPPEASTGILGFKMRGRIGNEMSSGKDTSAASLSPSSTARINDGNPSSTPLKWDSKWDSSVRRPSRLGVPRFTMYLLLCNYFRLLVHGTVSDDVFPLWQGFRHSGTAHLKVMKFDQPNMFGD